MNKSEVSKNVKRIITSVLSDKMFQAIGLQLVETNIHIENNSNFALRGRTFAYYNQLNNSIHFNIEDKFFDSKTNEEFLSKLFFVVIHEVMHKFLLHTPRQKQRNHRLWNIAADCEIHNLLVGNSAIESAVAGDPEYSYSIKNYLKHIVDILKNTKMNSGKSAKYNFCYADDYIGKTAEQIYKIIEAQQKNSTTQTFSFSIDDDGNLVPNNGGGSDDDEGDGSGECDGNGDGNGSGDGDEINNDSKGSIKVKVRKTTIKTKNGEVTIEDVEIEEDEKLKKNREDAKSSDATENMRRRMFKRGLEEADEKARVKKKGEGSWNIADIVAKIGGCTVDWNKIFKSSIRSVLARSAETTWSKFRTATYSTGIPMPGFLDDSEKCGTLILCLDESGSMSDETLGKVASTISDIKDNYSKLLVIKHDTEIVGKQTFDADASEIVNYILKREACGGTSHIEVFKEISKMARKATEAEDDIACVVCVTDGESDLGEAQKELQRNIPVIYVVESSDFRNFDSIKESEHLRGEVIKIVKSDE